MDEENTDEHSEGITRRVFARQAFMLGLGVLAGGTNALAMPYNEQRERPERKLKGKLSFVHGENEPLSPDLAENADQPFYTASLIKLVTLACVFEDIKAGKLDWDDKIKVSNRAMTMSEHTSWHKELTVREACEMAGSISLNDATIALAEHLGRGGPPTSYVTDKKSVEQEQQFVTERMMPLVERLGMDNTQCVNATGFPVYSRREARNYFRTMEDEPNNQSTLQDMAILTSHILDEYPEFMDVFSVPHVDMYAQRPTKIYSSNLLLPGNKRSSAEPCDGVIGMKTGFINASNHHLICVKEVDGAKIVSMTIGSAYKDRASEQRAALDAAVEAYQNRPQHEADPVFGPQPLDPNHIPS